MNRLNTFFMVLVLASVGLNPMHARAADATANDSNVAPDVAAPAPVAPANALSASVDRTRLGTGETVDLTLESTDVTLFGKPDLKPLEGLFEVVGTRQVNHLTAPGDSAPATTRWIITLQPLRNGYVVIPALQLGNLSSQPIALQVQSGAFDDSTGKLAPVFIDASLDADSVYVQAQAVLTLRVYHSVSLYDDSKLSPLQIPDARVEALGEPRTYEKMINGVRHGVIEQRYAIFPQHSGELLIPALVFSATLAEERAVPVPAAYSPDAENPGSVQPVMPQNLSPRPGKTLHVSSSQIPLIVKPKPASYPANAAWLPARNLSLSESWNPAPEHSQVGDSLTRSISLTADGLASSQLPPLPATEVNGLRRYPDQPQLLNQAGERGLLGSRAEREALVPTRAGQIDVPAVEVTWWNTREDHLEHARLPPRSLQVAVNPALAVDTPVNSQGASDSGRLWPWQAATLLFGCTTLIGFGLWWRARQQPAVQKTAQVGPSPRTLLDDLKRACLANDPHATRQALDAWARQQPETLADMAARFVPLSGALDGLNGALYSEAGQHWQGDELWRAIQTIPPAEQVQALVDSASLPPLYPK